MMRPLRDQADDRNGPVACDRRAGLALPRARGAAIGISPGFLTLLVITLALSFDARADSVGDDLATTGSTAPADFSNAPDAAVRSDSRSTASSLPPSGESQFKGSVEPRRIYDFALSEMAAGRLQSAQRQLELFVAGYPDHPEVATARRHLATLYQNGVAPAGAGGGLSAPQIEGPRMARGLGLNPGLGVLPPRRVVLEIKAPASLEDSFASEAGDRVFFSPGSAELGQRARLVLQAQARWLKRYPALFAVIEGHADDEGLGRDEMLRLSQIRAESVYRRLVQEGVPRQRLATSAWGRDMPVASCDGAACAAQNRRSVTVLTLQRVSELPAMELGTGRAAAH